MNELNFSFSLLDAFIPFRCAATQDTYDEILKNPNDEQSQIALNTIENMTKLYANFAKYG